MQNNALSLVVLAAGIGARYGGLKQMDPLGPAGETILDYSVFDAARAGFDRVVFVIRRDFEAAFRERAKRFEKIIAVDFVFQNMADLPDGFAHLVAGREKPWGTAHAVRAARHLIKEPFAVINADDFYGAGAYRQLAAFLRENPNERGKIALVAFQMARTLSENGAVSRGVCTVDTRGLLAGIEECVGLVPDGQGGACLPASPQKPMRRFEGDTLVSMNCWGFSPDFFEMLEREFASFLRARGGEPKAECYLPAVVNVAVERKEASVRVLHTEDSWFGVTYRQDAPRVREALEALSAEGVYPSPLIA